MIDSVKWSINNKCNLKCPFCFIEDMDTNTLPLKDLYRVLEKFSEMGIQCIDFFGKEVLWDNTIFKIMEYSDSIKYFPIFTMITNGVNLEKFKEELLNSPLRSITVSYDVMNHRTFRVSYETLKKFVDKGFYIELAIDIHGDSSEKFLEELPHFMSIGVTSLNLNPIMPFGSLSHNVSPISELDYEKLLYKLIEEENKPYTYFTIPFEFKELTNKYKTSLDIGNLTIIPELKCTSGVDHFYVDSSGIAYGCVSAAGACNKELTCNILDTPVNEVFRNICNLTPERRMCKL